GHDKFDHHDGLVSTSCVDRHDRLDQCLQSVERCLSREPSQSFGRVSRQPAAHSVTRFFRGGREEVAVTIEIVPERPDVQTGFVGDLAQRHSFDTLFNHKTKRGFDDLLTTLLRVYPCRHGSYAPSPAARSSFQAGSLISQTFPSDP